MSKKAGSILVSVMIVISVILMMVATYSVQSFLLGRGSLDEYQSSQADDISESLLFDAIQNFMRFGTTLPNPYINWTGNCLHEPEWMCKMVTSLTDDNGGTIETWGQYGGKIKHLKATIEVQADGRIAVAEIEERFE